ncbi:ribonuclease J [Lederbergia galactosidilytica]|uniref:Ribonuclease J n=1 Tax=Lederbergia galactosidilytica TaxID=217031 RepID=A0A177ZX55_9BACI|nr:ribonuclease J [Lederbergia galactosidilytica]KRG09630.1 Zn-dependent hydrolase [Virgibacillus soli]MBP1913599.1 ribonuclease J [Lederbergia galactosidilytica]OAK72507.1 Zn-dependent hydrolase [Lederbergia galactosidilytica]
MVKTKNEVIKVIPLGGVGEIGKNMYVIEIDSEIFIIDAGLMFPENEMLGIDIVIPDITWLVEQKERIKAIFLTHGHEDAIGALPYIFRKLKVPVYGSKLTIALAKEKMKEQDMKTEGYFHTIKSSSRLRFDGVNVTFFHTTHSIPDSLGVCIHTSEGKIVHTGDFKFDQAATEHYRSEMGKMANIGESGVLCLLSDSTEAERPGFAISESVTGREISDAFHAAKGRIIVACFASNFIRIQQALDASFENNRKVAVVGKSIEKSFEIALKMGYITVKNPENIIPIQDIEKYKDHEVAIIFTGVMGEPIEALQKMARQNHKKINVKKDDTVLITATPSPAFETSLFKTIDMLSRAGATVGSLNRKGYVSGHGSQEDLKLMLNLMKPKYFIPIQGEYRMLYTHAKLAEEVGLQKDHIFIPGKGDVIEYKNGKMSAGKRVQSGNVLIDGIGVGDVGNIVLRDRKLLSQDGIFIVVVTINKKNKKIASGPEIISRGFVYVRESEKLLDEASKIVRGIAEEAIAENTFDWASFKQDIRDRLNHFLYEQTKRRPMILPIIMEV